MDNTFVKMLKDFGEHKEGEEHEIDSATAKTWIDAGLAEATNAEAGMLDTIVGLVAEQKKINESVAELAKVKATPPKVVTDEIDKIKGLGHFFQLAGKALNPKGLPEPKAEAQKQLGNVYKSTMQTGSGVLGGYLAPEKYINELFELPGYTPEFFRRTVQIPAQNTETITLPVLDQSLTPDGKGQTAWGAGVKITNTKQDTKSAESNFNLKKIELKPERKSAHIPVSNHMLRTSAIGVEKIVKRLFNTEVNSNLEYECLVGNGVANPLGILTDTDLTQAVTRDTASDVRYSDVCNMWQELPAGSQQTAIWMVGQKTISKFLQMTTDGTNGIPVFHPSAHDGVNMTLFGRPIFVSEFLSAVGTAKDVVLLDPAMYYVAVSLQPTISMSDQVEWLEDNTMFKLEMWVDGQPAYNYKPILGDGSTTVSPSIFLS
jgi:HK97 family phage major capsid protein